MTSELRKCSVAIVGFGPSGLGALEALALEARKNSVVVNVDIFDPFKWPGAGPNFDPDQSDLCILNIPIRALNIDPPDFLSDHVGPFPEWSSKKYHRDDYPPRSDLGAYLTARFTKLVSQANDVFIVKHAELHGLDLRGAYAVNTLLKAANGWTDATVAVRGLT